MRSSAGLWWRNYKKVSQRPNPTFDRSLELSIPVSVTNSGRFGLLVLGFRIEGGSSLPVMTISPCRAEAPANLYVVWCAWCLCTVSDLPFPSCSLGTEGEENISFCDWHLPLSWDCWSVTRPASSLCRFLAHLSLGQVPKLMSHSSMCVYAHVCRK